VSRDRISSAGELVCRRALAKTADRYAPGQHAAVIVDPHPHRDRADLAAILTYVDDDGRACSVTCLRYRDERGWRAVALHRATLRRIEPATAAVAPELVGDLLATVEAAARAVPPFPYEEPSAGELAVRCAASRLVEMTRRRGEAA
jgi:hypothetical protein